MLSTIERIQNYAKKISAREDEKVQPGQPATFTRASQPGDPGWQGDLKLKIVKEVPAGYVEIKNPTEQDLQLVPGNTQGAKHCLDSFDGVTLYRPEVWNEKSLIGPCFILTEERKVLHPTHGDISIPEGFTVQCIYQRVWDHEQQEERRAKD